MSGETESIDARYALKQAIRREAHARRRDQLNKDILSSVICGRFAALPDFRRAGTVMLYVDVRSEVRTRPFLLESLAGAKKLVVPYCSEEDLGLFHLQSIEELAVGGFGLLEPRPELRHAPAKRVEPAELELLMVPGVAFDRRGGRLGHGKGCYDRLLHRVRRDAAVVAVAFECQLFPEIPMLEYDVFMDKVVTEQATYEGRGR